MAKMDSLSQRYSTLKGRIDQATTAQMNATRHEKHARESLSTAQMEVNQAESDLRRLTSKVILALDKVSPMETRLEKWREEGAQNICFSLTYAILADDGGHQ